MGQQPREQSLSVSASEDGEVPFVHGAFTQPGRAVAAQLSNISAMNSSEHTLAQSSDSTQTWGMENAHINNYSLAPFIRFVKPLLALQFSVITQTEEKNYLMRTCRPGVMDASLLSNTGSGETWSWNSENKWVPIGAYFCGNHAIYERITE